MVHGNIPVLLSLDGLLTSASYYYQDKCFDSARNGKAIYTTEYVL